MTQTRLVYSRPVHVYVVPHEDIKVDVTQQGPCVEVSKVQCDVPLLIRITGTVDYFLRTCPNSATADCADSAMDEFLSTGWIDETTHEIRRINYIEYSLGFLKSLAKALTDDFVKLRADEEG